MRLFEAPPTLVAVVALLLTGATPAAAGPFSRLNDLVQQGIETLSHENDALSLQNSTLELKKRQSACGSGSFACGWYGQVCCLTGSQTCATNAADEAYCADSAGGGQATAVAGGNGQWQMYTSIWTTTGAITMTSVYSSFIPAAATGSSSGTCVPNYANNESPCGGVCCSSGEYCFDPSVGDCRPAGNGGYTTTGVAGATNSPPTRPTTSNGVILTMTLTPTTTVPYNTPIATGQSGTLIPSEGGGGGGLSGGAIAGIVIGVIAGIILLILICLCCCLKAGFDGLLALIGLGKKKRRRVVEEEYVDVHRRYGSQSGSGRRWYGSAAGGRPGRPPPPEKKSGLGNLGAIGLGLGGLAVALGLKRRHDRKHDEKSDVSSSYYDSYYYSSSSSSGSRNRRASHSRR